MTPNERRAAAKRAASAAADARNAEERRAIVDAHAIRDAEDGEHGNQIQRAGLKLPAPSDDPVIRYLADTCQSLADAIHNLTQRVEKLEGGADRG